MPSKRVHRVLLVTTGGTVSGHVARLDDLINQDLGGNDGASFQRMIAPAVQYFEDVLDRPIEVVAHYDEAGMPLCDLDSSDIRPAIWSELAQLIYDRFADYDAFIITHGTNTLGYTCAALSFAVANSGKPIILTGSQVPAGYPGADALTNLENALRIAVWDRPSHEEVIQGVLAVFGSHIITGTRVKKDTAFDYDAMKPFGVGSVGRIGRIVDIDAQNLAKHRSYLSTGRFPTAYRQRDLVVDKDFDMSIMSLSEFPGMNAECFATLVEHNDVQGFILRAFGAGDPSASLRDGFEYLKNREIPIVVTSQAPNGNSSFEVNAAGKWLRDHEMAIPSFDMSIEAQTTKLAWLLAKKQTGEMTYRALCQEMVHDLRGEIRVRWELGG
jgi:L-asparaginase